MILKIVKLLNGEEKNVKYFKGEKEDVLSRFYHCAIKYKIDTM